MNVILMRGLPGSGKSYTAGELANTLGQRVVICSADHFFYDSNGIYNFDFNKLGAAHGACKAKFVKALEDKENYIFVDNTNTTWSEIKDYVEYAALAGATVFLAESNAPWAQNVNECFKRNTHGVPLESLQKMKARYAPNEHLKEQAKLQFNMELQCDTSLLYSPQARNQKSGE